MTPATVTPASWPGAANSRKTDKREKSRPVGRLFSLLKSHDHGQDGADGDPSWDCPLSHFQLDHPEPPEGWANFLGRHAIAFRPDDIGRDSIRRSAAQKLLHEHRADQLRRAKLRELAEQEAVEADQQRRAQMPRGVPVGVLPEGVRYADVVRQAEKDAQPRRRSLLEEALSGQAMTYHPLPATPDGEGS